MSARIAVAPLVVPRLSGAAVFAGLVVACGVPAFMLRLTGVMDDSVFWVVARSVDAGKVLYRDIYFTQPPLFIVIPQAVWWLSGDPFVQRAFLLVVWLANGWLFSRLLDRVPVEVRLACIGIFLAAAFALQSYALHTEVFILTGFLLGCHAIVRRARWSDVALGLAVGTTLMVKPLAPLVFIPCVYCVVVRRPKSVLEIALGAALPVALVLGYLLANGTLLDFWQEVVVDNGNVGLALDGNWMGYFSLVVATLVGPAFVALIFVDAQPRSVEWWLSVAVFAVLLALEVLRGARHYGLLNLCVLAWMAVNAQERLAAPRGWQPVVLRGLMLLAMVCQLGVAYEILARGTVREELSAAASVDRLPRGSLQVFANDAPRIYMLLNRWLPAYPYLFVYDTNRDRVIWDSYLQMVDRSPPAYIAVADDFVAVEYGRRHSTQLTNAAAVRAWLATRGDYRPLDDARQLGITVYQRMPA